MKKHKNQKGGNTKMKTLNGIVVLSLVLLLTLGTFASFADAAMYRTVNKNAVSLSNSKSAATNTDQSTVVAKTDTTEKEKPYFGTKGDINNDGLINFRDIDWFRMVYYNQWFFKDQHPDIFWRTDIDDSGTINHIDIDLFVALLSG
ncbi:MAG: hypothetical protein ABH864_02110 [archaeon]